MLSLFVSPSESLGCIAESFHPTLSSFNADSPGGKEVMKDPAVGVRRCLPRKRFVCKQPKRPHKPATLAGDLTHSLTLWQKRKGGQR